MKRNNLTKMLKLNIHSPGTGIALIILAITQIPIAIKTIAELACIGEISHVEWKTYNSHKYVNVKAISICNGGSI